MHRWRTAGSSYLFVHIRPAGAGSPASSVLVSTLPRCLLFDWPARKIVVSILIIVVSDTRKSRIAQYTARSSRDGRDVRVLGFGLLLEELGRHAGSFWRISTRSRRER